MRNLNLDQDQVLINKINRTMNKNNNLYFYKVYQPRKILHQFDNTKQIMFALALVLNCIITLISCARRYRSGGGRAGAGFGRVSQTFGKGVATLIKDIKQGNWGEDQLDQEEVKNTKNRFIDKKDYYENIGNDTTFYVMVVIFTILIVIGILYFIIKVLPKWQERDTVEQMKKRNADRFKHYEAIKLVAETGIHPDKAFGRLQKIKYK